MYTYWCWPQLGRNNLSHLLPHNSTTQHWPCPLPVVVSHDLRTALSQPSYYPYTKLGYWNLRNCLFHMYMLELWIHLNVLLVEDCVEIRGHSMWGVWECGARTVRVWCWCFEEHMCMCARNCLGDKQINLHQEKTLLSIVHKTLKNNFLKSRKYKKKHL